MLDVVKWTATATLIVSVLVFVMSVFAPQFVTIAPNLAGLISSLLLLISTPLYAARGLINFFFAPWALPILSFAIIWMITKPFQLAAYTFIRSIIKGIFG